MTITVTEEHIRRGTEYQKAPCFMGTRCPIALAFHASGFPGASVSTRQWWPRGGSDKLPLPPEAARFVTQFDARNAVNPFAFDVEAP